MARGRLFSDAEDAIITQWWPDYGALIAAQKLRAAGFRDRTKPQSVSNRARQGLHLVGNTEATNGYRPKAGHPVGNPRRGSSAGKRSHKKGDGCGPGRTKPKHPWGLDKQKCEMCQRGGRVRGERFCVNCRSRVLAKVRRMDRSYSPCCRGDDCGPVERESML